MSVTEKYQPKPRLRFITAGSLFDGHDVTINIIRRLLQASGVEVIHLGHNRSVHEIVQSALQEDVDGIAVSSYQGGHVEFFTFLLESLKHYNLQHIKVFGGGGGVITPNERKQLEQVGVSRIYLPEDGQIMGLQGMINDMLKRTEEVIKPISYTNTIQTDYDLAGYLSAIERGNSENSQKPKFKQTPIIGITGTGGSGKSSLTDEIIWRLSTDKPELRIAILALDPCKQKTGGALLGDRIRMNSIYKPNIFLRSLATRVLGDPLVPYLNDLICALKTRGFDLIFIETPGIGQGDAGVVPFVDYPIYVMSPEFGAPSQLEKIEMLEHASFVVINKIDKQGADDAVHDVKKQMQRNQALFDKPLDEFPVFGTIASQFNNDGVNQLYVALMHSLSQDNAAFKLTQFYGDQSISNEPIIPVERSHYLGDIVASIRAYHHETQQQSIIARECQHLAESVLLLGEYDQGVDVLSKLLDEKKQQLSSENSLLLDSWEALHKRYSQDTLSVKVNNKQRIEPLFSYSLSELAIPRVSLPTFHDHGERLAWLREENVPGQFPYTAGTFLLKRHDELPSRMFAGEGGPEKTNQRFKLLSGTMSAKRLSTAFDSVTLYGCDPSSQPDIYGKIGNAGVAISTIDDMSILFDGFDLCDERTSVSMTINGPAPIILAMFFNVAISQQCKKYPEKDRQTLIEDTLQTLRGTVQADILKEDQAQNTCIFSTDFSLKLMGDVQAYFIEKHIKKFYSVSVSGYHIAEAGANPITQLAFTLANGFTYVEAFLARGMAIDDFSPNLSFFFSNGMCPEYTVMGRVARRIWAIALRDKYHANEKSQQLKYHVQTSGRSLHAQEMAFNDIRTTLEALEAIYDQCNSLHTNAYDEALTTPTLESVRRAQAIQLIINQEWGLTKNENPLQGAFIIEELTQLVEEAVLSEFVRLNKRGGVLGAMETAYQRHCIQEQSLTYERQKHSGELPLVGVNTFIDHDFQQSGSDNIALSRSTEKEKQQQIKRLAQFQQRHNNQATKQLANVERVVREGGNVFSALMEAVQYCSLGQLTDVLYKMGGQYRRNL